MRRDLTREWLGIRNSGLAAPLEDRGLVFFLHGLAQTVGDALVRPAELTLPVALPVRLTQEELPGGGVVVSNGIELALDVEAILLEDLEPTSAIEYYRD